MWGACRDRKLAFLRPCIIVNKIALLAKMPTHAQTRCCVLEVLLGLSSVTSLSLGPNADACGDVRKHQEGHGVLEKGAFRWQHFFSEQKAETLVSQGLLKPNHRVLHSNWPLGTLSSDTAWPEALPSAEGSSHLLLFSCEYSQFPEKQIKFKSG